ncbi:glycosyltransferase family 4 protein [Dactylosporangium sp. NPDC048998]|uniref:glycosyltransferase family 4 protein n=1 Tax=Dactylosporangium sp. NPDC048998 TaxID=3363976 RepID=UPI0037101711
MKLLLAQNMYYLPSRGGANKSNRLIMERLAERGHDCHVVAPLTGQADTVDPDELPGYLQSLGARLLERSAASLTYVRAGVTVHGVLRGRDLSRTTAALLGALRPDWALVSNDDPGMMLLSAALRGAPRVLYLVHTVPQLPFGPRSFFANAASTAMIRRTTGVVSVSEATRDYVQRWSGIPSEVVYPDVYSGVPLREPDPARQRYVTLINPCAYKGIDILLQLADALPGVPFLAVQGWGTSEADRAELHRRPNIRVEPGTDDVDEIYGRTRVLLMPSLWDEAFGYCSVEAMLRGVPVLAADVCGLREAKLGVDHLLPVNPIERYPADARTFLPRGEVPVQDVTAWRRALEALLGDAELYRSLSARSRAAARAFVDGLDRDAIEGCLRRLTRAAAPAAGGPPA